MLPAMTCLLAGHLGNLTCTLLPCPVFGECYRALQKRIALDVQSNCPEGFRMRDGAVRAEFQILEAKTPEDWFGIYLRVGANLLMGGYLVYVRQNGLLEVAAYPGPQVLQAVSTGQSISGRQILTIEFENDYLEARLGATQLNYPRL